MSQGWLRKRMDSAEKKVDEWPAWMKNLREPNTEHIQTASHEQTESEADQREVVKAAGKKADN